MWRESIPFVRDGELIELVAWSNDLAKVRRGCVEYACRPNPGKSRAFAEIARRSVERENLLGSAMSTQGPQLEIVACQQDDLHTPGSPPGVRGQVVTRLILVEGKRWVIWLTALTLALR